VDLFKVILESGGAIRIILGQLSIPYLFPTGLSQLSLLTLKRLRYQIAVAHPGVKDLIRRICRHTGDARQATV
jgi:hypothetical protein